MAEQIKRRYSYQREMIYQYLLSTKAHPSAEMIYESLKADIQGLSLGTVYRNLKLLEEMGQIRRVANYHDTERYDACCADHVHFLCTGCGCIDDIDGVDTDSVRKTIPLTSSYQLNALTLTLTGLCPACAAQN